MKNPKVVLRIPLILACVAGAFGMVFTNFDSLYLVGTIGAALFALLTPMAYLAGEYREALRSVTTVRIFSIVIVFLALGSAAAAVFRASFGSRQDAIADIGGVGSWAFATLALIACTAVAYVSAEDNYRRRDHRVM